MSEDTLKFCRQGAPFKAVFFPAGMWWVVRSALGEDVATAKDPDGAVAVAEALNEVGKGRKHE